MIQCRLVLKPDGLFLAAILGGETLKELRITCTFAQMECEGGISPRMSPSSQVHDVGNILTRAGFTLPRVHVDQYNVKYNSAVELVEHLRVTGETNALFQRSLIFERDTTLATMAIYQSMFGLEDGTIPATFHVFILSCFNFFIRMEDNKKCIDHVTLCLNLIVIQVFISIFSQQR